jgi:hypothetical protein
MAHPCDYYEKSTYSGKRSNLFKSPSTMNRTSTPKSHTISELSIRPNGIKFTEIDPTSDAYILISNFIRENPTWALSSAYAYCLKYYAEFGATKEIFGAALHSYILSKN